MPDLAQAALTALVDEWTARLREAREQSRTQSIGDAQTAYYYKGAADTYQQAIADLQELLGTAPQPPVTADAVYASISQEQAGALLAQIGLYPRSLHVHADHVLTAVFSRLQPLSQEARLNLLTSDPRIIILDHGRLADTGDPFIDFAFTAPL